MKENKFLNKQISKFLPQYLLDNQDLAPFIRVINDSYNAFERDTELADRASRISENEYEEVYKTLKSELEVKKVSISKLKEVIRDFGGSHFVETENDDLPEIVEFLKDQITKRREAEENLIEARELAEESLKAKESFLANMSHEIRTPMNAILGMSRQLAKTSLNSRQHFYLDAIQGASENLLIILNDILDLSKIEAGKLTLENIGFEPNNIVTRAMQVFMHKAEEKGLNITNAELDRHLSPVLIGDPFRLNQIILNLMSNAIKFTDKGYIDLSCYVVNDTITHQTIEIRVKDTGVGMDKEFLTNVFQKFLQEDKSIARKYGGTGLGMAICKQLIELMDGNIQVESQKNVGSTFIIQLTMAKGTKNDLPKKSEMVIDTAILRNKNILLVEDNEMNRLLATIILNAYGASVRDAHNGLQAIEAVKESTYDLILMDVQMPIMDGFQATRHIRETLQLKTPIIALTANALKGENDKCLEAGMDAYLTKPFIEEELILKIAELIHISTNCPEVTEPVITYPEPENIPTQALETTTFNLEYLHEVCGNNKEYVRSLLDAFLKEAENTVIEINKVLIKKDVKSLKSLAHKLKPSLDLINALHLRDVAQSLEDEASYGVFNKKIQDLATEFQAGVECILEELNVVEY